MTLLLAFLIGVFAGLRSLTPPAAVAWAACLGWLRLDGLLAMIGSMPAVAILTLLAALELVGDKLSIAPNRTETLGLVARIGSGGVTGACVAVSGGQAVLLGALLGAIGGVVGCFAGYRARVGLVKALGTRDLYVALVEDVTTIAGSLWVVSRSL